MKSKIMKMELLQRAWSACPAAKRLMNQTTWNTRPSKMVCVYRMQLGVPIALTLSHRGLISLLLISCSNKKCFLFLSEYARVTPKPYRALSFRAMVALIILSSVCGVPSKISVEGLRKTTFSDIMQSGTDTTTRTWPTDEP